MKTKTFGRWFYGERCCDECQEIIHSHFYECPVCNEKNAGTDWVSDERDLDIEDTFKCEECKAKFTVEDIKNGNITLSWAKK